MVKQERAVRTREALIRSAAEVFHQEGFTAASLTVISSRAGVSNGALHFHFASKAVLADAVEDAAAGVLQTIMDRRSSAASCILQHIVDATHELACGLRNDAVLRAGFELSGEAGRVPRTDLRLRWKSWVTDMVERAGHSGELRETVALEGVASAVVAATVGFEVLGNRDAAWLSRRTVSQFWLLLLPALTSVSFAGDLEAGGSSPR
ncbi:ScbR family autoregulator-binding transcription factor [Streptomyces lancefieldiae]|uniref:ScbR family autoregulator-binding transcription factor n=1 Tax=Streptomyces lancefieldiae TaxID=3075520 RepID=A0ABU3ARC1_9ACTN|nr:ScbR family autoregulator-binding transcription factor [Streptomyces sp. DSM 40712]MDT0612746.1 ScbR family autoregulator-binding transcription factor [Streptomyces sp. DSM 40712]